MKTKISPGAMRAADVIRLHAELGLPVSPGIEKYFAEIIDRETHCSEMLEVLEKLVEAATLQLLSDRHRVVDMAVAVIAKVKGAS